VTPRLSSSTHILVLQAPQRALTGRTLTERTLQGLDGLLKQLREMLLQGMKSVLREVNLSYRCVMRLFQAANALALLQVVCWKLTRTSMLDAHTHEQKHAQAHAWECTHTHARTRCSAVFEDACGDEREKCAALLPGVQLVRQEARRALLDLLKAQVRGCVAGCVLRAVWLAAGCVAACCLLRAARCRSSALLDLLKAQVRGCVAGCVLLRAVHCVCGQWVAGGVLRSWSCLRRPTSGYAHPASELWTLN